MIEREAFRLLGLAPGATDAEVRAAFRKKVMERHPDTAVNESSGPDVQDLVEAYRLLVGSGAHWKDAPGEAFGEQFGAARRVVIKQGFGSASPRSSEPPSRCKACNGVGLTTRVSPCRHCGGAGQVTVLDVRRVQVSRCRSCQGHGEERTVEICEVCGGPPT